MKEASDMIFLLSADEVLQRVLHAPYESEELLQRLIERYPELLVGDQIDPEAPPKWLLIAREVGIPDAADGAARWSIDHLLIDQFGRPTFVEVKRSSDTRIRREVVGQILDYAANGIAYWPPDRLRHLAADQYGGIEQLDDRVIELLDHEVVDEAATRSTIERFWGTVERNLREGQVRLLFVAGAIPRELRRIIEFLNEKMSDVEVLGIEVRQYRGEGISALVPRVVGLTESARDMKDSPPASAPMSLNDLLDIGDGAVRRFLQRYIEAAEADAGFELKCGVEWVVLRVRDPESGKLKSVAYVSPSKLQISLQFLAAGHPNLCDEWRQSLKTLGLEAIGKWTMGMALQEESVGLAEQVMEMVWRLPDTLQKEASAP